MKIKIDPKKILLTLVASFISSVSYAQILPEDVTNVIATPGNGAVSLSWDDSEDSDGAVIGYKVHYGTSSIQSETSGGYEDEILVSTGTAYTINQLQNGTPYYFAVTAVDDEENESRNYSGEVTATPQATAGGSEGTGATPAPAIGGALAVGTVAQISNTEFVVSMTKEVQIQGDVSSFYVEEKVSGREIPVVDIFVEQNQVHLFVEDDTIDFGKVYTFTATSLVEDLEGNPIRSGITDTAELTSRFIDEMEAAPSQDLSASSEAISLDDDFENFGMEDDFNEFDDFEDDDFAAFDDFGAEDALADDFTAAPVEEVEAPLDATGLEINAAQLRAQGVVELSWVPALDIGVSQIEDQILYTRMGMSPWDDGISLGKYTEEIEIDVQTNKNYEVRIVTVNDAGLESDGVSISFSTHLTASGPSGSVVALMIVALFGLFLLWTSRRMV